MTAQQRVDLRKSKYEAVKDRIDSGVPLEDCVALTVYLTDKQWQAIKRYAENVKKVRENEL